MQYTLVVVDMQPDFLASLACKEQVKKEVRKAVRSNNPIIFLEYKDDLGYYKYKPTYKDLVPVGYDKVIKSKKTEDSGARNVVIHLNKKKLPKKLKVCGVNTQYCVFETVSNLIRFNKLDVTVVAKACNCENKNSHERAITWMKQSGANIS